MRSKEFRQMNTLIQTLLSTISAAITLPWEPCYACGDIPLPTASRAVTGSQSRVAGRYSLPYTFILFLLLGQQESIRQHWWEALTWLQFPFIPARGWGQLSPCSCLAPCPQAWSQVLFCAGARGEFAGPPALTHPLQWNPNQFCPQQHCRDGTGPSWCPRSLKGDACKLPLPVRVCDLLRALLIGQSTKLDSASKQKSVNFGGHLLPASWKHIWT